MPINLNNSNFDKETSSGLVLVDFWAPWCGPCKLLHPEIEKFSKKHSHIKVCKFNIENDEDGITRSQKISAIPTILLYNRGICVKRINGFVKLEHLEEELRDFLA